METEGLVTRKKYISTKAAIGKIKGTEDQCIRQSKVTRLRSKSDLANELKLDQNEIEDVSNIEKPTCESKVIPKECSIHEKKDTAKQKTRVITRSRPTVKTTLAKKLLAKAKRLPSGNIANEKSPKRFILPTMSARSSRIIKPNKRLFADITDMCSTVGQVEAAQRNKRDTEVNDDSSMKRTTRTKVLLQTDTDNCQASDDQGDEGDKMSRSISLYADAITNQGKGQVGRPPKKFSKKGEICVPEIFTMNEETPSPSRDPKENKMKEKIEKLLRSPWDNRLKNKVIKLYLLSLIYIQQC